MQELKTMTIPISKARNDFFHFQNILANRKLDALIITRYGKPHFVVMATKEFEEFNQALIQTKDKGIRELVT